MKRLLFLVISGFGAVCHAQDSTMQVSGFVDVYYAFDFNKPDRRDRLYTTQPARHNEFNLNYGFIQLSYQKQKLRSNFALQSGTYVRVNYAAEPEALRYIYQANIGYVLNERLSIDAGILPSHIGIETAVSIDNWNYSRNMASDFSPYYQCGVHVSYQLSRSLFGKFAVLNGFQNIQETNNAKSVGLLLEYKPTENVQFGYSNYFGNEAPSDSIVIDNQLTKVSRKYRFFNDLYVKCKLNDHWDVALVGERNTQQELSSSRIAEWYTAIAKLKYSLDEKFQLVYRWEWYSDERQIVAVTGTENGFQVTSSTLTFSYFPENNIALRIEGRSFHSKDPIYPSGQALSRSNSFVALSTAIRFN